MLKEDLQTEKNQYLIVTLIYRKTWRVAEMVMI